MDVRGIQPNDCLVMDNVVTSARNLIQGYPLTPINFADLCSFIEMAVLHQRIVMTIPSLHEPEWNAFARSGIITSNMFTSMEPAEPADRQYVTQIYTTCARAIAEAGTFGRGIVNMPSSREQELEWALKKIRVGALILQYESGAAVEPGAEEAYERLYALYGIFKAYADSVFDAARHFHVSAYTGSSEIACSIRNTIKSVPQALYDKLKELQKDRVDKLLVENGFHAYEIPPFASIVLSRAKSRDDIIPQILTARDEFVDFRTTCTKYAKDLEEAARNGTNEQLVEVHNDLDRAMEVLTKRVRASSNDSRFVFRVWDVVKETTPWGIGKKALDGLKNWDIDRRTLQSVNGMFDVWQKLMKGSSYQKILRSKLFAGDFRDDDFVAYDKYLEHMRGHISVPLKR